MMRNVTACAMSIGLALAGCAVNSAEPVVPERGVTPGYICDSDKVRDLIGQITNTALGAAALQRSGAKKLRWIPPNSAVTMDFRQDRLNIEYDAEMKITRVNCG